MPAPAPSPKAWFEPLDPIRLLDTHRFDDIWLLSPADAWICELGGTQLLHTSDGGWSWQNHRPPLPGLPHLRCLAFSPSGKVGWVGGWTQDREPADGDPTPPILTSLLARWDGATWNQVTNLPAQPVQICGLWAVDEQTLFAAGTNDPGNAACLLRTVDGGATWTSTDLSTHADNLIDVCFKDAKEGWVVGGIRHDPEQVGPRRNDLHPVVLHTTDGGATFTDCLDESARVKGEWGWKIHFVDNEVGYVSLESETGAAILATNDGGRTWTRRLVPGLKRIQGIGFIDRQHGWVAGQRIDEPQGFPEDLFAETTDGGKTWTAQSGSLGGVNRFRFIDKGEGDRIGYASGHTVFKFDVPPQPGVAVPAAATSARTSAPWITGRAGVGVPLDTTLPGAASPVVQIKDPDSMIVRRLTPGSDGTVRWDGRDHAGRIVEPRGHIARVVYTTRTVHYRVRVTGSGKGE